MQDATALLLSSTRRLLHAATDGTKFVAFDRVLDPTVGHEAPDVEWTTLRLGLLLALGRRRGRVTLRSSPTSVGVAATHTDKPLSFRSWLAAEARG